MAGLCNSTPVRCVYLVRLPSTRRVIDKAKAILQRDLGLDEQGAYHALQRESRDRRKSMREIADAVLLTEEMRRKLSPQPGASQEH